MLFEYVTKGGQIAKVEAKSAEEALAKATNKASDSGVMLSTNQVDNGSKALPPLPPTKTVTPAEKTLPPTKDTTSRLLQFSSALDTATKIAQKKRLDFQSGVLRQGVAPGVRSASDFSGLLSGINRVDQNFVEPLVDTAVGIAKSDMSNKTNDFDSIAKTAAQNGAPKNVIDTILGSGSLSDALVAAGEYIRNKSSIDTPPSEKSINSGSLKFTPRDISIGASKLQASAGDDGYVDPSVYLAMYKEWTKGGGLPQDFTKYYPPKTYVNPKNDWLPASLRSGTGSFSSETNDISSEIDNLF